MSDRTRIWIRRVGLVALLGGFVTLFVIVVPAWLLGLYFLAGLFAAGLLINWGRASGVEDMQSAKNRTPYSGHDVH